jgi:hypothetical protein
VYQIHDEEKQTQKHNTTQKTKKSRSNMGHTKVKVLAKIKQFLVGEDSQSMIHISPCCAYVVYINREIVHENYKQDAYKYQCQNRWQPLVASMCHMGTCDG